MNVTDAVKSILPWIGTALGGPLGGIAAGFVGDKLGLSNGTVETVKAVLGGMSPEKLTELKGVDYAFQVKMATLGYDHLEKMENINASVLVEINKTIQTETTAEHWPSYSWRPFIGFMFGLYIASLFILPLFHVTPIKLENEVVLTVGAILGVASWFRGKAQADPEIQNTQVVTPKG